MSETIIVPYKPVMRFERGRYGVVANVVEIDRVLRMGARVWMVFWWGERPNVHGLSRSRRAVTKFTPWYRLNNFRVKWIHDGIRAHVANGTRDKMAALATELQQIADQSRHEHPNRRWRT